MISRATTKKALRAFRYLPTRQTGSHLRLTSDQKGQHHVTVPRHKPVRLGTLAGILGEVAAHFGCTREEVAAKLFN